MRDPDYLGSHGKMWRVPKASSEVLEETPDFEATLGLWLIYVPKAHPAWTHYLMGLIHLRDVLKQTKPAQKNYPEAEYEVLIYALDPTEPLPEIDDPNTFFRPKVLVPVNLIHQFHGVTDNVAVEIINALGRSFIDGYNSPDTDFNERTISSINRTIEHHVLGDHTSGVLN